MIFGIYFLTQESVSVLGMVFHLNILFSQIIKIHSLNQSFKLLTAGFFEDWKTIRFFIQIGVL